MNRLVIVSNRVADLRATTQTGGLAVGLADALKERGGVWFGWNGEPDGVTGGEPQVEMIDKVKRVAAPLSPEDVADYYFGYANSVLWPLFHYRLDLVDYRPAFFASYSHVNEAFARQLLPFLEDDDLIWVHDYHLIPLAGYLRKLGCRQRIGFFLHIPFPPPDLLAASPNHEELVEALLDYDVVGFQSHTDAANLKLYLAEHNPVDQVDETRFRFKGRTVLIDRFPIGIDAAGFAAMAREADEDVEIDLIRQRVLGRRQVIGVDRLDYSKGLPERFKAFGQLLEQHPEMEKAVSFLQIAPPTREEVDAYSDIRTELETLSGSINGRFADFNWTPIRYIHRSVSRRKLAPLFRGSHVGFITPLRDGMNLVAKEYVAAQDPEDPGVLVLSKFAGAAEEMQDALIVNPYDTDDMARQLHIALTMPLEERRRRHATLFEHVVRQDARAWLESFLAALNGSSAKPVAAERPYRPTG
ncbi:trehalose-6-phosphate synthase [Shinella daejeonensis]|uniref:alpha,alpha-trehalose-phosphate synthase (UDP-forming) n=1 Tax=Shinella daejeonensis TaxID=659017 RepID=UPI0020C82EA0|nr:trehalose-6-phosphate synthase [Shinella daejeonensis]MCP8896119.1 trehalose-6-phosphate synthase [Shinella daejeonensis]